MFEAAFLDENPIFSIFYVTICQNGFFLKIFFKNYFGIKYRESVVAAVIQAAGTVEFENGLRTGVLSGGCWCPYGGSNYPRINLNPPPP